ncbi:MAG: hypothetical protein IJZ12_04070 [Clostridia bacterium]|nr:hypothetical protein [Clostridia bacterium]
MKKFMKAIAFVTVMCMALSTVAFAAGTLGEATDKTFTVTVTGAGNDQVALMVVAAVEGDNNPAYNFSNPLYIDQTAAAGDEGKAEFTAKIAADVDAVDVYVGYASNPDTTKAAYLGEVALVEPVTAITVAKVDAFNTGNITENETESAESDYGYGYACKFTITAPDGVSAQKMVWAITYKVDENNTRTVYSDSVNVSAFGYGSVLTGETYAGVAFSNGSRFGNTVINPVQIVDVDAIFLFSNDAVASTADTEEEHDMFIGDKKTN